MQEKMLVTVSVRCLWRLFHTPFMFYMELDAQVVLLSRVFLRILNAYVKSLFRLVVPVTHESQLTLLSLCRTIGE
jgi:hypothetical protein